MHLIFHVLPTGGSVVLAGMQFASNVLLKRRNRWGWAVTVAMNVIGLPYDWFTAQYGYMILTVANLPVAVTAWRKWGSAEAARAKEAIPVNTEDSQWN